MTTEEKLSMWKARLDDAKAKYDKEVEKMERRDRLYEGDNHLRDIARGDTSRQTPHVRNIVAELIEAEIDSSIPQPKVTAMRKKDEPKAKLIEDMLRNELDRLPMEVLNDQAERTVPIQGGALWLLEWDNTDVSHSTVGEIALSLLNPREVVPQDGVYTGIEDMDWFIVRVPQTKAYIKARYGKDVSDKSEEEPDLKAGDDSDTADDLVTQYMAYYRNDDGGIGLYSWVCDTVLEDLEDYQARRLKRCANCGETEPSDAEINEDEGGKKVCPNCGSTEWEESTEDYEIIHHEIMRNFGLPPIPGDVPRVTDSGVNPDGTPFVNSVVEPTRIPFYKPDIYPIILQKNVSVYGQFLGTSDVDLIADQQNTVNRVEKKIIDKLMNGGSYMTLPEDTDIPDDDTEEKKVIRIDSPDQLAKMKVLDMEGSIQQDIQYLDYIYEEARKLLGITDSFQGRKDTTATSGKAKEFAAAQTAGRLESKRIMKQAAYAALFEAMFKFKLAYADEPRSVVSDDDHGERHYQDFNRYDFLEQDENGEWYWNDRFLFSCDTSAPLAQNREAMWQETRANFQTGAFGDPADIRTLILFWHKMEVLHYPDAADTRTYLEDILRQQEEAARQQQMAMAQQQAQQAAMAQAQAQAQNDQALQQAQLQTLQRARQDAQRDAAAMAGERRSQNAEARESMNFIDQRNQMMDQARANRPEQR